MSNCNVYFAAPLFCPMELERNLKYCEKLEDWGFTVYLPQRDGGEAAKGANRKVLFHKDIEALCGADAVIAFIDGRVPDEGMCFEMGYAYAANTPVVAVCEDARSFENGKHNLMLTESVCAWCSDFDAALHILHHIISKGLRHPSNRKPEPEVEENPSKVTVEYSATVAITAAEDDQTIKQDAGKPKLSLCPLGIIEEISRVREFGNKKYPQESWKEVDPGRYLDAALRHLYACADQHDLTSRAEDSGLLHLSHAACNIAFMIEMVKDYEEEEQK